MARNRFIAVSNLVILLVAIGNVVAQSPTESFLAATSDGCDGDISFELFTGYVYRKKDDFMDVKRGILQLADCIEFCKSQPQCQALNFETGLCVLISSQAGDNLGLLAVSLFPVFTLYGQKVCLCSSRPPCNSAWVYETTPGLDISKGFTSDNKPASSRQECAFMCIMEERFICRAAAWDASSNTCKLSQVDRNMARRKQLIQKNDDIDYIELGCVVKPDRMCTFQRLPGKIMKTVDAVYQDIQSPEDCKEMCLNNTDFSCYSYDFGDTGEESCRLSHHSSATLAHIDMAYLESTKNATTFELQSCYQHVTQPPTPVTQPPTAAPLQGNTVGPLQAPLQGCALGTAIYRNGDNNTDSCLVMQCNNGDWEYTGEIREQCGNCTVEDGYVLFGGNKPTHFWTFDDTKFLDYGHQYEFGGVGNFVITQPGFDYSPSFGVNADLQTCNSPRAANLSCIQSITYREPGIKVELVIPFQHNITTPKGGITVIVNDRVQKSTIGVKSASAFFGTDGTVLVFKHNDIEEPANLFCNSVVGSQGLSVSLCLHKMNPPSLYVFPMPILRNAPKSQQLYGLCNTYTGNLQDYFIARKEPNGLKTTEKDTFGNSWKVQK